MIASIRFTSRKFFKLSVSPPESRHIITKLFFSANLVVNSSECLDRVNLPPTNKLLAYADDVLIFLNSVEEFQTLQVLLSTYNSAFNSKINYHKSVAFPLSGSSNSQADLRQADLRQAFRLRTDCTHPNVLTKLKRALGSGQLEFAPFFAHHMLNPIDVRVEDSPPLNLCQLNNPMINAASWRSFIQTPMLAPIRNVWFRLIHQKISNRVYMHQIMPRTMDDDLCTLCQQPEPANHLMFLYPHKELVWTEAFEGYFRQSNNINRIAKDIIHLRLSNYVIKAPDRITIYDAMGAILFGVWCAHWQLHFEGVPFEPIPIANHLPKQI
ncbi:hypothetical protein A0J61_10538, partial [Choanephora cucurbitarum]